VLNQPREERRGDSLGARVCGTKQTLTVKSLPRLSFSEGHCRLNEFAHTHLHACTQKQPRSESSSLSLLLCLVCFVPCSLSIRMFAWKHKESIIELRGFVCISVFLSLLLFFWGGSMKRRLGRWTWRRGNAKSSRARKRAGECRQAGRQATTQTTQHAPQVLHHMFSLVVCGLWALRKGRRVPSKLL